MSVMDPNLSRAPLPELGTVIGHYRLVQLLGHGGMGAVYKAEHVRMPGLFVALKWMLPEFSANPEAVDRFWREAQMTVMVRHENVVQVQHVDESDDPKGLYIVMEFLDGTPLTDALTGEPMQLKETLEILRGVCAGLDAAHQAGIVHRDLKPDNVFLSRVPGRQGIVPKLLDFGISKPVGADSHMRMTKRGIAMGTVHYMSPEQAINSRDVDHRTDIYALGVIAYEALSGVLPFNGSSEAAILLQHQVKEPDPLGAEAPWLPPSAVAAVHKALSKDPSQRFASASAFFAELSREASTTHVLPTPGLGNATTVPVESSPQLTPQPRTTQPSPHAHDPATRQDYTGSHPNTQLPRPDPSGSHPNAQLPRPDPSGSHPNAQLPRVDPSGSHPSHQVRTDPTGSGAYVKPTSTMGGTDPFGDEDPPKLPVSPVGMLLGFLFAGLLFGGIALGVVHYLDTPPDAPSAAGGPTHDEATPTEPTPGTRARTEPAAVDPTPVAPPAHADESPARPDVHANNPMLLVTPPPSPLRLGLADGAPGRDNGMRGDERRAAPTAAYTIQQHEVTWREIRAWLARGGAAEVPPDAPDEHPATGLPWQTARAYCQALPCEGGACDLPTEAQWEYAARGASLNAGLGVASTGGSYRDAVRDSIMGGVHPVAVDAADRALVGGEPLHDMMGNAVEWTRDPINPSRAETGPWFVRGLPVRFAEASASERREAIASAERTPLAYRALRVPPAEWLGFRCVGPAP